MKYKTIVILAFLLASFHAIAGGMDRGGANFKGSDPEQIKRIFNGNKNFNLKDTVKKVMEKIKSYVEEKNLTPELESIFSRMLGPKFGGHEFDIFKDIAQSPYDLLPKGQCPVTIDHPFGDASTIMNQRGAPICFSLESLTRLPIQAVPYELVTIAIHEHAHHYNFDEREAKLAEKYVLDVLLESTLGWSRYQILSSSVNIKSDIRLLINSIDNHVTDMMICKQTTIIHEKTIHFIKLTKELSQRFDLQVLLAALNLDYRLIDLTDSQTRSIFNDSFRATRFCGLDDDEKKMDLDDKLTGNRVELRKILFLMAESWSKIVDQSFK